MKFTFLPAMTNKRNSMLTKHVCSRVNASNFNSGEPDLNLGQKPNIPTEGFHGFPQFPRKILGLYRMLFNKTNTFTALCFTATGTLLTLKRTRILLMT
jgi:hypothetical protein